MIGSCNLISLWDLIWMWGLILEIYNGFCEQEEEVEQPEGVEETEKKEFVGGEIHSPLKGEGSDDDDDDDDDPNRWDEYKFDY